MSPVRGLGIGLEDGCTGGNVISSSFNPNDPVFGAHGFAWQTATPIVFLANAAFDSNVPATFHMGVLAPGDANGDARVNAFDVGAVKASFNSSDRSWSNGDFTQAGRRRKSKSNRCKHGGSSGCGPVTVSDGA
jgi:hypothetical protein